MIPLLWLAGGIFGVATSFVVASSASDNNDNDNYDDYNREEKIKEKIEKYKSRQKYRLKKKYGVIIEYITMSEKEESEKKVDVQNCDMDQLVIWGAEAIASDTMMHDPAYKAVSRLFCSQNEDKIKIVKNHNDKRHDESIAKLENKISELKDLIKGLKHESKI